jgi:hypothetical protein
MFQQHELISLPAVLVPRTVYASFRCIHETDGEGCDIQVFIRLHMTFCVSLEIFSRSSPDMLNKLTFYNFK